MGDEVGIRSTSEGSREGDVIELGTFPQSFGLLIVDGTEFGCSLGSIRAGNVMVDVREGDVLVWNDGGRRGAEKGASPPFISSERPFRAFLHPLERG